MSTKFGPLGREIGVGLDLGDFHNISFGTVSIMHQNIPSIPCDSGLPILRVTPPPGAMQSNVMQIELYIHTQSFSHHICIPNLLGPRYSNPPTAVIPSPIHHKRSALM